MATLSNILLDKEILLESGTNELEVLVFDVAEYTFGINVAKVREVLPAAEITALPRAHRSIRGVFKLRNRVIPCVSLLEHLGIPSSREDSESTMILTDLNQQQTAFLVDGVERIHRLSWEHILPVPGLEALSHTPVTALARCDRRLILMLDFEMILDDVTNQYFRTDEVANPLGLPRETLRLLLAEDSPTVREAVGATLRASGYTQLHFFENGAEAWDWIGQRYRATGRVEDVGDLLIADVEMPQVDGLHLTKQIKEHAELRRIPVLLYSSIITPDNRKKGNAVGADAQVAKPELAEVVRLADELISHARQQNRSAALREVAEMCETSASPLVATSLTPAAPSPTAAVLGNCPEDRAAKMGLSPSPARATFPRGPAMSETSSTPAAKPAAAQVPAEPAAFGQEACHAGSNAVRYVEETPMTGGGDPLLCPRGTDVRLWCTFHRELIERTGHLRQLLENARRGDVSEAVCREIARTLHTIKSASMVVPVDPITRCTHLTEGLLETSRTNQTKWPHERLLRYVDWLTALTSATSDVDAVLAAGADLESTLAEPVVSLR